MLSKKALAKTFKKKGVVYGNVKSKNKTSKNNEIIDKELNTESSINKRDKIIIHTVKKGDTLIKIAKKYTTTVAEIQRINKLKTTTIQINQILKIK